MNKKLVIFLGFVFLLWPTEARAQSLQINSVSTPTQVNFSKPSNLPIYTEAPPWIIPGGWRSYFLTTDYSYFCATPDSLTGSTVNLQSQYCTLSTQRDINQAWRRNYSGVFSAHIKNPDTPQAEIMAVVHGENKNEVRDGTSYQNTVNPNIRVEDCYSGYDSSGQYHDCWEAYYAFLNLSHIPYDQTNGWGQGVLTDEGPITWPVAGYVNGAQKASNGLRHPSSIVANGYLYVYYLDTSPNSWGIKVIRAPVSDLPNPNAFKVFANGSFTSTALPSGFNKNSISSFYSTPGPASTCIIGCTYDVHRFSVAKVRNSNLYLGVEERNNSDWNIVLRTSSNLVNWSDPVMVLQRTGDWTQGNLHYPAFLDKTGWTNSEVDLDDLYILGTTSTGANTNRVHVSAQVSSNLQEKSLVFNIDQSFANGVINKQDSRGVTRIIRTLKQLQAKYPTYALVNIQNKDVNKVYQVLDQLQQQNIPFIIVAYSSDTLTIGAGNSSVNLPYDLSHGVALSVNQLAQLKSRYSMFSGIRIFEVFAMDFTLRACRTTNPEWCEDRWKNAAATSFFDKNIADQLIGFTKTNNLFVIWSDWHWYQFDSWDSPLASQEQDLKDLINKYPYTVVINYANNEQDNNSRTKLNTWDSFSQTYNSLPILGIGLSDQAWMCAVDETACPISELSAWANSALAKNAKIIEFEPYWYFFQFPRAIVWVPDTDNYTQDPVWKNKGYPTQNLISLTQSLGLADPLPTPVPGDVNGDDEVNATDYLVLIANYAQNYFAGDFNSDGKVNIFDFNIS